MESLISANMVHATATPPTRTSTPPSLAPIPEAVIGQVVRDRSKKKKVRFCEKFTTTVPCADTCCDEYQANPEELEQMKTARRTVERRAWDADRGAASEVFDINVAQALEAKVSRSVRWSKET